MDCVTFHMVSIPASIDPKVPFFQALVALICDVWRRRDNLSMPGSGRLFIRDAVRFEGSRVDGVAADLIAVVG